MFQLVMETTLIEFVKEKKKKKKHHMFHIMLFDCI